MSSRADGETASSSPAPIAGPATLAADHVVTSAPIAASASSPASPASADFDAGWYIAVPMPATSASTRTTANVSANASPTNAAPHRSSAPTMSVRRDQRSASAPNSGASTIAGRKSASSTRLTAHGERNFS